MFSLEPKVESSPLVIPKLENADWRMQVLAKKRKKNDSQEEHSAPPPSTETVQEPSEEIKYGLQISKRTKVEVVDKDVDQAMEVEITETDTNVQVEERKETLEEMA